MKEQDVVNKRKPAVSSTLSEERRTEITKLDKVMAFLCSIYNVSLKHMTEYHESDVEEDLSGKVTFVLVNPPCTVRSDQENYHAKYDMLGWRHMKDRVMVLGDIMKPGAIVLLI